MEKIANIFFPLFTNREDRWHFNGVIKILIAIGDRKCHEVWMDMMDRNTVLNLCIMCFCLK